MPSVDASNACIPPSSPLIQSIPPLPTTTRGKQRPLEGQTGRINQEKALLAYGSGRLVVVRSLHDDSNNNTDITATVPVPLVYRGHSQPVSAVKFSGSGSYVASGDARGKLRVWAYDHEEHLPKLDSNLLTGPIRDISWDMENKRIAIAGERSDATSACTGVVQWDTGVTCGTLAQHVRGKANSVAFKPTRPMRIVTSGQDDGKCYFHQGPPFARIVDGVPCETAHAAGSAVNCVRYNHAGTLVVSVGADKSLCLYDGKTLSLVTKLEQVHDLSIYMCAWSANDQYILTASVDGTCKLFEVTETPPQVAAKHTWNVASAMQEASGITTSTKVPIGAMQLGCAFVNGNTPVSVSLNGQLAILPMPDADAKQTIQIITGHSAPIASMAVSNEDKIMYTGDTDGVVCQWNMETGQPTKRLVPPQGEDDDLLYKIHGGAALSALALLSGSNVLLSVGWDDKLKVAKPNKDDNNGGAKVLRLIETTGLPAQPNAMVSGTNLAAILTVGGILLVESSGKLVGPMFKVTYEAISIVLSKNDKSLYVGDNTGKIHVYEITSSSHDIKEVHVIEKGHQKAVHSMCLSNDQTKLASADVRDVCVWDVKNNAYTALVASRWCFHTQRITALAWSLDDTILASGGADDSIYIWSLDHKAKRIHYPFCHRGGISGLKFLHPPSNGGGSGQQLLRLVSVGADACVNQWDITKDVAAKFV